MNYGGLIVNQIILNGVNNKYVGLIQTFITICFLQIGGVRLGSATCEHVTIVEVFTNYIDLFSANLIMTIVAMIFIEVLT